MFKPAIQFPQPNKHVAAAGGIKGMHDTLSPVARSLGVLTSVVNFRRYGPTGAITRWGREQYASTLPPTTMTEAAPIITGMASYYFGGFGNASLIVGYGSAIYYSSAVGSDIHFNPMNGGSGPDFPFIPNAQWTAAIINDPRDMTVPFPLQRPDDVLIITSGMERPWKWNGRLLTVSALQGSPPHAKYVCVGHGRVFLGYITQTADGRNMAYPSGVYVSDKDNPEIWPDSSSLGDDATFDNELNGNDGDHITWMQMYHDNLVVWKQHTVWEWHGLAQTSINWQWAGLGGPGCVNGRTIMQIEGVLYWLSYEGIVRWSGAKIEVISNPAMNNTIATIDWLAAATSACATYDIEGNYILTVPKLGGGTTTFVFCTKDESWWTWADWNPEAYVRHRATGEGEEVYMVSASDRKVYKMGGNTGDAGTPIVSEAVFGPTAGETASRNMWVDGQAPFKNKLMRRAYFVLSGEVGATMYAQTAPASIEPPVYQSPVLLDMNTSAGEARHFTGKRCYLPFISGIGETIHTYAPRMRLTGHGKIMIHDAALEYAERES